MKTEKGLLFTTKPILMICKFEFLNLFSFTVQFAMHFFIKSGLFIILNLCLMRSTVMKLLLCKTLVFKHQKLEKVANSFRNSRILATALCFSKGQKFFLGYSPKRVASWVGSQKPFFDFIFYLFIFISGLSLFSQMLGLKNVLFSKTRL